MYTCTCWSAEVIHRAAASLPKSVLPEASALEAHLNAGMVLHVNVPHLETTLHTLKACSDADVLDMDWNEAEAKSMGVSGGAIVLDPTGYCLRVCQAAT